MTSVGVLLAAGTGSRFEGGNKLCQPIAGEPIVRRATRQLLASPVEESVVVLGYDAKDVLAALGPLADHLDVVRNEDYRKGQSTSASVGARAALERDATHALFALGDMPWVAHATYARLIEAASTRDEPAVVPTFDGRRGNPVAFDARALHEFDTLTGDTGARALFGSLTVARLAVDDPGIHADVDTFADLE
ncbi:nucleotidyltransferase family protein [Halarchaeum salinum]|uniref:MobA-like NTP transferase domain-containing protein n=1 Tax=Halarchaeum salinum TaxID=489912 RepID=A0AAV3S8L1_9EURY